MWCEVNWTQIETWIALAAAVGLLVERFAAWRRASGEREKAKADAVAAAVKAASELYEGLCAKQQERIGQLQTHLVANEARIEALETEKDALVKRYTAEIEELERQLADLREALAGKQRQIETLQGRVAELEMENARLRQELDRLCKERAARGR